MENGEFRRNVRCGRHRHSQFSRLRQGFSGQAILNSQSRSQSERGAIALLAMLILMAAALTIAAGLSLRGLGNLQAVDVSHRGEEAFDGADGCVTEALRRLRDNGSYTGGAVTIGNTACTVTVADDGGGQRTIHSAATRDTITRHVRVIMRLGTIVLSGRTVGTREVTLWEENPE
ncbi:MAG: hypothetical protein Q8R32_02990 [bacterium]|nr:hypothetical protein [bacterium]